jgi:hypothetical protein
MAHPRGSAARELRTPVSAALAGIVFAVIVTVVVVLLRSAIPEAGRSSTWVLDPSQRHALAVALDLIPYAGIAFLWFIGVIRFRLGDQEDKLFATAFLGSGLLFVAMLFAAAAVMGGLLSAFGGTQPVSDDSSRLATAQTAVLVGTLGIRMAAVFTMVVTNLGRRTGIVPRWLVVAGYAAAVVLLLAPPTTIWVALLFPAWVFTLSVHILVTSLRSRGD